MSLKEFSFRQTVGRAASKAGIVGLATATLIACSSDKEVKTPTFPKPNPIPTPTQSFRPIETPVSAVENIKSISDDLKVVVGSDGLPVKYIFLDGSEKILDREWVKEVKERAKQKNKIGILGVFQIKPNQVVVYKEGRIRKIQESNIPRGDKSNDRLSYEEFTEIVEGASPSDKEVRSIKNSSNQPGFLFPIFHSDGEFAIGSSDFKWEN